jgi:hypothetical protein
VDKPKTFSLPPTTAKASHSLGQARRGNVTVQVGARRNDEDAAVVRDVLIGKKPEEAAVTERADHLPGGLVGVDHLVSV